MSITPAVELRFHPTDLDHATLREALRPAGTPSEAIEAAIMMARLSVVTHAKAEVAAITGEMSAAKLIGAADVAWQLFAPKFIRSLGPVFADQYYRTMKAAGAGEIPMATVYALAEQHAARVGTYYHESSRDALVTGFNTFVNRRMTERVAADRVLDGYGLTARGMAGYTSRALDKAETSTPLRLKQRALDYIGTSVRRRSKLFATQEEHNLNLQAQQIAWMWLQEKGQLTPAAEKVWITARDEKVCPQCGPMHNTRVMLSERFRLPNGTLVYVPGVHPNCRCEVRLLDHPWKQETSKGLFAKAETWNPKLHPRGGDPDNAGRFSAKARTAKPKPVIEDDLAFQQFLDTAAEHLVETEPKPVISDDQPRLVINDAPAVVINDAPTVVINDAPEVTINDLVGVTKPLTISDQQVKPMFAPSQQQRLTIHEDTKKAVIRGLQEVALRPKPKPTPLQYKSTIRLDGPGGPGPMYYVANPFELAEAQYYNDDLVELNTEMEFGQTQAYKHETQEEAVQREAETYFDELISSEAEAIWEQEQNYLEKEGQDGTELRAVVPEDELYNVVAAAAWNDPGGPGDETVKLQWTINSPGSSEHGAPVMTEDLRYSQIAKLMGLEQSQYAVKILVLTEGHDSDLGKTIQLSAGTKHGEETWAGTGLYKLEPATGIVQEGHGAPIQFMHLVPEGIEPHDVTPPGFGVPPYGNE